MGGQPLESGLHGGLGLSAAAAGQGQADVIARHAESIGFRQRGGPNRRTGGRGCVHGHVRVICSAGGNCRRRRFGLRRWREGRGGRRGGERRHKLVQFGRMGRAEVLQVLPCRFSNLPSGRRPWVHGARGGNGQLLQGHLRRQWSCRLRLRDRFGNRRLLGCGWICGLLHRRLVLVCGDCRQRRVLRNRRASGRIGSVALAMLGARRAVDQRDAHDLFPRSQAKAGNLHGGGVAGQQGMGQKGKQHAFLQRATDVPNGSRGARPA